MVWLFVVGSLAGLGLGCWGRVPSVIVASALSVAVVILFGVLTQWSTNEVFLASLAMLVTLQVFYLVGLYLSGGAEKGETPGTSRNVVEDGSSRPVDDFDKGIRNSVSNYTPEEPDK